jgi:asparagine synthase (glutamine-hydrolysing)
MCGITGFWDISREINNDKLPIVVQQMSNSLIHRGPDDQGHWVDTEKGIALGHRRLAIVDLSPLGHQPMMSVNERYIIVFNGEVYNFIELRQQLELLGHRFRSHSDTEVMLASFTQWGVIDAVKRFNGMFAFALWDCVEEVLHLGRDRLGEKPLYYGWIGKTFIFASELKALKTYPDFQPEINRNALALFLRLGYIPTPYSIYEGIYKLPPGTLLSWNGESTHSQPIPYWSFRVAAESGIVQPFTGTETEAIAELETLLLDAVKMRMIADVPLGAFLSGGIDSSTVVALMQATSSQSVKTFSIGFHEDAYNEAHYAKAVAQHLGCQHTEYYVTPQEALAVIPKLANLYDEPFSDASQIPTFLVSQLARKYVTVTLSGDGGDELFTGYERYFFGRDIWQKIGWIPQTMRHISAKSLTTIMPTGTGLGEKVHKFAEILALPQKEALYNRLISHWKQPETIVINSSEPATAISDQKFWLNSLDFTQHMMYVDSLTYLPDDILTKVDRASMGVSLESRVPLLDHRVVEFAWRIPLSMKIRSSRGKWLLRQVLYKYVPQNLIDRPKMGFGVPIDSWLREPLQDWAEALLDKNRLQTQGFFNPEPIRQKWTEHLSGNRNWHFYLWDVLMFQAWLEENLAP